MFYTKLGLSGGIKVGRPFDYLCKMIFFLDVDHFKVLVCYHIVSVFLF